LDDTEHVDSPAYTEIEITDLDPPRGSKLASTFWQYSQRHRRQARLCMAVLMCIGVFMLAIAALPPWLAQLSRHSNPAMSVAASTATPQSAACSQATNQFLMTSPGQSTDGTPNVSSANGGTIIWSTPGTPQSVAGEGCIQVNGVDIRSGANGASRQQDVRVRIAHQLSGGGIQWYSMR
jgi:hypothetical protein